MSVPYIPEGMTHVTPYLIIDDIDALIDFATKVFDATLLERMERNGQANHAEIRIEESTIMMGKSGENYPSVPTMLYVYVKDADATYQKALEYGAETLMEPSDEFYGDRNAGVRDTNGILWWIATHKEDVSAEELHRRNAEIQPQQ